MTHSKNNLLDIIRGLAGTRTLQDAFPGKTSDGYFHSAVMNCFVQLQNAHQNEDQGRTLGKRNITIRKKKMYSNETVNSTIPTNADPQTISSPLPNIERCATLFLSDSQIKATRVRLCASVLDKGSRSFRELGSSRKELYNYFDSAVDLQMSLGKSGSRSRRY